MKLKWTWRLGTKILVLTLLLVTFYNYLCTSISTRLEFHSIYWATFFFGDVNVSLYIILLLFAFLNNWNTLFIMILAYEECDLCIWTIVYICHCKNVKFNCAEDLDFKSVVKYSLTCWKRSANVFIMLFKHIVLKNLNKFVIRSLIIVMIFSVTFSVMACKIWRSDSVLHIQKILMPITDVPLKWNRYVLQPHQLSIKFYFLLSVHWHNGKVKVREGKMSVLN